MNDRRHVGPSGPLNAKLMIVGEAPGSDEVHVGRPFVGAAGELLRNFLQRVGIDPEECFLTNLCRYQPPGNKLEAFFHDGGFPNELVVAGLQELSVEIERVCPNLILALGNFPLAMLTGKGKWVHYKKDGKWIRGFTGIHDYRGSILHSTLVEGFKVIPTFHPSYINREGYSDHGIFQVDLSRVKEEMAFPEVRRPVKSIYLMEETPLVLTNYLGVVDKEETPEWFPAELSRQQVKEKLLSTPEIPTTLDIEYIGSKLLCCGLTTDNREAFVIPTVSLSDELYLESIVKNTRGFNAQNSMFDAAILEWHYRMPIMQRVVFDTMIVAHAANIELPKSLEFLISIYLDQPFHKGMVDWKKIAKGEQSLSTMYVYNGIDVWTQHQIMEEQQRLELTDEHTRRTYNFMMQLLVPLWEMSKRGIKIDMELLKQEANGLNDETAMAALDLMILMGASSPYNVKSGPQMAKLLFEELGLKPGRMNETGPATDDKTLAALQLAARTEKQREAVRLIRAQRRARDLLSKFFDIKFDKDGRMRGHYDPTKTVTGRLASRKFFPTGLGTNQQNIPRDKRARRVFVADQGKVFGFADLEKAESLVVAHLTGDPRMLFDHSPGQNAHRNLGAALFDVAPEELDDDQYYLSKKTRHAGNYMQGWMTFMLNVNQEAQKTGVSIDARQAKRFIARYKELHPGLPAWWRAVEERLRATRMLENLLGRRRVFYDRISSILPEGVAFTPQSTVGDTLDEGFLVLHGVQTEYITRRGLWEQMKDIYAELLDCGFEALQQVHDSVGFQCDERHVDRALPLIRRALSIPLTNPRTYEDFIIPVELQVDIDPEHVRAGKSNWGDCKVWKGIK